MEPKRNDQDKRGEIPLLSAFKKDVAKGKIAPERRALESQRAHTDVGAAGPMRLSSREKQGTAVDGFTHTDGSLGLGGTISLQAFAGMKPRQLQKSPPF